MEKIENILFYINNVILVISFIIGTIYFKKLAELKPLFAIPLMSILQNLSRVIPFLLDLNNNQYLIFNNLTVYTYIIFEFIFLAIFFHKISRFKKIIQYSTYSLLILIFITSIFQPTFSYINLKYFLIFEGIFIEFFAISYLIAEMKKNIISNIFANPIYISVMGIFLSFSLIWPSSMLLDLFSKGLNKFQMLFEIINYSGYILFFISLSMAFYGKRKSNNL